MEHETYLDGKTKKQRPTKYGMSIYKIAARTGLKPPHVGRVLSGRGAKLETVYKIAAAMGITTDEFIRRFYGHRVGIAA